ncbi:alpha/beta fold hydrolase [Actinocatenispora comari]|jgi:pimeloyl-ACP methyl ester carboxylesterase|nr:alpha/beta fold hydrolase [Actinocatenispora comari]
MGRPAAPITGVTSQFHGPFGRMRSRAVGRARPGVPEVAIVQGLGVSEYLLPAVATLATWTRAHLVELPGLAGSGEPPYPLELADYAESVRAWVDAQPGDAGFVLGGHSAGTQTAAHAAVGSSRVIGVALAAPTVDPAVRGLLQLAWRWRRDGAREPGGLTASHLGEWRRAGPRRLLRLTRLCLADDIGQPVRRLRVPVLVLYGADDRISDPGWVSNLADEAYDGELALMPGAHTFVWSDPEAWSEPLRAFAARCLRAAAAPHPAVEP